MPTIHLHPDSLVNVWQVATAVLIGAVLTIVAWPLGLLWGLCTAFRQLQRRRRIRAARRRTRALFNAPVPVRQQPNLSEMIAKREATFRARSL